MFPAGSLLQAGSSVLVVADRNAFEARYGHDLDIAGVYEGQLDNGGEEIGLRDNVGENVLEFEYDDEWYPQTDGLGYSLQVTSHDLLPGEWSFSDSWKPSVLLGGMPGVNNEGNLVSFRDWASGFYSAGELEDAAVSGPEADSDGDLKTTLMEYALNTNPVVSDIGNTPDVFIVEDAGQPYLAVRYLRRANAVDLTYRVQVGDDLALWQDATVPVGLPFDNGDGTELVVSRDTRVFLSSRKRFFRLSIKLVE